MLEVFICQPRSLGLENSFVKFSSSPSKKQDFADEISLIVISLSITNEVYILSIKIFLFYRPTDDTPCRECGQYLTTVATFKVGNGASEMAAVRDQRMTNLSWQEALSSDMAPDFKVTNISVFDKKGHYISISKVIQIFSNLSLSRSFLIH
jgi:hypothetical protein